MAEGTQDPPGPSQQKNSVSRAANSLQVWETFQTSLMNISTGSAYSIKSRNLNPQESGDIRFVFVFNHKSNPARYFGKKEEKYWQW